MGKKYYEVVFEGKFDVICGMLEGFMLASGSDWEWYSSKESSIETETLAEIIREWTVLKSRLHHVVMEEDFHLKLQKATTDRGDMRYFKPKYIRSAKKIKSAFFRFEAVAYAKKYGDEIKAIISSHPAGVVIENYSPVEQSDPSAKEGALYAPEHSYTFKCEGLAKGDTGEVLKFRKAVESHPLIKASKIKIQF